MTTYKAIIKFKNGVVGNVYIPAESIATAVLRLKDIFENSDIQEFDIKEHLAEGGNVEFNVDKTSSRIMYEIKPILTEAKQLANKLASDLDVMLDLKKTEFERMTEEEQNELKGDSCKDAIKQIDEALDGITCAVENIEAVERIGAGGNKNENTEVYRKGSER